MSQPSTQLRMRALRRGQRIHDLLACGVVRVQRAGLGLRFHAKQKVCGSFVGAIFDGQEEGAVCVRARAASSGRQVAPVANVRHSL